MFWNRPLSPSTPNSAAPYLAYLPAAASLNRDQRFEG